MSHAELQSQLENCKNNFILSLAGVAVLVDPSAKEILTVSNCSFGGYNLEFAQVVVLLASPSDRELAFRELVLSHWRALLKESYELVKTYADDTEQTEAFQSFPSYRVHRVLRNAMSHNFYWSLRDRKGNLPNYLPLSWNGVVIDGSLDGTPVRLEHFGYHHMWKLFIELFTGAKDKLR